MHYDQLIELRWRLWLSVYTCQISRWFRSLNFQTRGFEIMYELIQTIVSLWHNNKPAYIILLFREVS